MLLRRFNALGIDKFREFIASLKEDKRNLAPTRLLEDDALTEVIEPRTECAAATFESRLDAAVHLYDLLSKAQVLNADIDKGLWSWLSLRFYDELMPFNKAGIPRGHLGEQLGIDEARFIPTDDYNTGYRHLLRHPLQVYRRSCCKPDSVLCFLVQPVYRPGDVVETFASRYMYSRYDEIVAILNAIIVDPVTKKIKPRATKRARRLDMVLQQFDCTWDLGFIQKELLIEMLPKEFKE